MLIGRTARRLGLPLRRGGRGSGRARPFSPSSIEGFVDDASYRPLCGGYGLPADLRAVARAPWDPRLHLPLTAPSYAGILLLGLGLAHVRRQPRAPPAGFRAWPVGYGKFRFLRAAALPSPVPPPPVLGHRRAAGGGFGLLRAGTRSAFPSRAAGPFSCNLLPPVLGQPRRS